MHELSQATWDCHFKTTNCRVKRHLISTTSHEHGSPAETKPDRTICAQGTKMGYILQDPKLYSKVPRFKESMLAYLFSYSHQAFGLTIEPKPSCICSTLA
jgi:hypothetical protein